MDILHLIYINITLKQRVVSADANGPSPGCRSYEETKTGFSLFCLFYSPPEQNSGVAPSNVDAFHQISLFVNMIASEILNI